MTATVIGWTYIGIAGLITASGGDHTTSMFFVTMANIWWAANYVKEKSE